jgi:DNA mismatch repair ATPase MutS
MIYGIPYRTSIETQLAANRRCVRPHFGTALQSERAAEEQRRAGLPQLVLHEAHRAHIHAYSRHARVGPMSRQPSRKRPAQGPKYDMYSSSVTPGHASTARTGSTATGTGNDMLCVCSLIENRAFEVGLAAIDLHSNHMMLTQLGDNQNYSATLAMLAQYDPTEIVVSNRARPSKLAKTVQAQLPSATLADIERKYFSDTDGMLLFKNTELTVLTNVTTGELSSKYLAAAAAFALHKYCSFIQRADLGIPLVRVSYKVHSDIMLLDAQTLRCLELIENTKTGTQTQGTTLACSHATSIYTVQTETCRVPVCRCQQDPDKDGRETSACIVSASMLPHGCHSVWCALRVRAALQAPATFEKYVADNSSSRCRR